MARFLFVLTTDDNEKATRCFQFAKIAHDKGHEVNLFLVDGGVLWARPEQDGSTPTTTGDRPADYLPALVEAGVPVGVCTPCAKARSLKEEALHPTMRFDTGAHLIDMAAERTTLTF